MLGQQVFERVARNLAAEPPELGADHSEPITYDPVERREHRQFGLVPRREAVPAIAAGGEADAGRGQDVEVDDVVGGAAVAQRPRATGIVAKAAADGGSGVGRRVWAESQPVLGRCRRDGVEDRARLHARRAGIRIDSKNPMEMAGEVDHDTGADRVAGYRRSGAATGDSNTETAADREDRLDLVAMAREDDRAGDDPVVGGVGGVFRPTAGGYVDVASAGPSQLRREVRGRDGDHPVIVSNQRPRSCGGSVGVVPEERCRRGHVPRRPRASGPTTGHGKAATGSLASICRRSPDPARGLWHDLLETP